MLDQLFILALRTSFVEQSIFYARVLYHIKCLCISSSFDMLLDELEAKLEELEGAELQEQLLQPATTAAPSPVHVRAGKQAARPIPRKRTTEEDEHAAL